MNITHKRWKRRRNYLSHQIICSYHLTYGHIFSSQDWCTHILSDLNTSSLDLPEKVRISMVQESPLLERPPYLRYFFLQYWFHLDSGTQINYLYFASLRVEECVFQYYSQKIFPKPVTLKNQDIIWRWQKNIVHSRQWWGLYVATNIKVFQW